jgi:RNA polymerase sigma-70 factor (ECF subfamily)
LGQRFEDLFLPYLDAAYSLARFLARDPVAADDIVQESFLRAFRSFGSYRGGDAKSWLLTIVRNCSFDWSKSNRRAAGVVADAHRSSSLSAGDRAGTAEVGIDGTITGRDDNDTAAGRNLTAAVSDSAGDSLGRWIPNPDELGDCSQDGPETAVIRQSEIDEVRAMIRRLPEPFRETLVLRELEELSYKQIAEVTGVPVGTVMSRLARARQMLSADLLEQMR